MKEAKKAEVKPVAPTPTQSVTEEKKVVEKKQEEKPVVKSEEVKPAAKTEEAKPTTTTNTEEAKPVKAEVKPVAPEPVQQKVETKAAEKVEEKAAAVSKPVETTAKPAEKKVESTPAPTPTPVVEKKVEAEKPKPAPTPSKAATSTTATSPSTTSDKPESKVPQIEVVNVRGDSKRVVQQLQPDVVDLSKFQSLRVSAVLSPNLLIASDSSPFFSLSVE